MKRPREWRGPNDYARPDADYDPEGAEWHDVTTAGSDHEIQIDLARPDHFRHRFPQHFGPWIEGRPESKET